MAAWAATPMRPRTSAACWRRRTRRPWPRPAVGTDRVVSMRIAVVLPAPLCPSRPSTVPAGTSRSRSRDGPVLAEALAEALRRTSRGGRSRRSGGSLFVGCTIARTCTKEVLVRCTNRQGSHDVCDGGRWRSASGDASGDDRRRRGGPPAGGPPAHAAASRPARRARACGREAEREARGQGRPPRPPCRTDRRTGREARPVSDRLAPSTCGCAASAAAASPASPATTSRAAAIRIADAEGLDALSMRRLAAELTRRR